MKPEIKQLEPPFTRLDRALEGKHVDVGSRFLYTINGSGACYEGTLNAISLLGHVKLDDSGLWHWPPEIVIEEILSQSESPAAAEPVKPWLPQEERKKKK